jgi:threonyl-tRNA synthetase
MLVCGEREAEAGTVSVRHRKHADMGVKPVGDFMADLQSLVDLKVVNE